MAKTVDPSHVYEMPYKNGLIWRELTFSSTPSSGLFTPLLVVPNNGTYLLYYVGLSFIIPPVAAPGDVSLVLVDQGGNNFITLARGYAAPGDASPREGISWRGDMFGPLVIPQSWMVAMENNGLDNQMVVFMAYSKA